MLDPAAKLMRGLTEALALESLQREPKHGYAIMKELEEVFGEPPNRNRIYPLLSRLEEEGYVEGLEDPDSSRGKTVYSLTDAGEARLEEYRAMPGPFRDTLERFWGTSGVAGEGPEEADPEPGEDGSETAGDATDGTPPDTEPEEEAGSGGDGGPEGDGDAGGGGGAGGGGDGGGAAGTEGGGMDLRRNPETGEVEMVIRGTHWGEVRIELGELRGDDD
jgi:DNA-binding PadR family transcriptional regulator